MLMMGPPKKTKKTTTTKNNNNNKTTTTTHKTTTTTKQQQQHTKQTSTRAETKTTTTGVNDHSVKVLHVAVGPSCKDFCRLLFCFPCEAKEDVIIFNSTSSYPQIIPQEERPTRIQCDPVSGVCVCVCVFVRTQEHVLRRQCP